MANKTAAFLSKNQALLGFCYVVTSVLCVGGLGALAEPVVIGVAKFPDELNLLESGDPAAWLVRGAVTAGITQPHLSRSPADPAFRLGLAAGMRSSADGREWSFELRPGLLLSSGRALEAEDLLFSLERCRRAGRLNADAQFDVQTLPDRGEGPQLVLKITLPRGPGGAAPPEELGRCPVLEASSSRLFGADLGLRTNLVSAGMYEIAAYHGGRQVVLRRSRAWDRRGQGPEEIVLRGFDDEEAGLTALRVGTISALFVSGREVPAKAAADETLAVTECGGYQIVRRRSFHFGCDPDLNVSEFRLES